MPGLSPKVRKMKANSSIQRRDFLRRAGAGAVLGWLNGLGRLNGSGASPAPDRQGVSAPDRVERLLETIARDYVSAPRAEAQFVSLLIKLTRARRVLELGTGYGYTTIWLAVALQETGGELVTVEIAPERIQQARQHVAQAGLSGRVHFRQGDAHVVVPTLRGGFDVAYLDADKDGQVDYFHKLYPAKLPPGGLLIAHNAILRADAMKDYLDLVAHHVDFETLVVQAVPEDGLALSYRRRQSRQANGRGGPTRARHPVAPT